MSQLPQGWEEKKLTDVTKVSTGKVDANHATEDGKYTFFTCALEPFKSPTYSFEGKLITLPGNGANVGHVNYYEGKVEAYQRTYVLSDIAIHPKYLYWQLKHKWKSTNLDKQFGSATNYLKIGNFKSYSLPIPPSDVQKGIADKLDSILAKVEVAQARLDKIPTILKRFRQSVLAAATSGELTKDWRMKNAVNDWETRKLIELVEEKPRNGRSPKGVEYETRYRNLTLSATTQGRFVEDCFKYVELDINEDSHLWVKNGDILIQRANSLDYVGVSALYEGADNQYVYPDLIMKCRANDQIKSKYLHYCLLSENVRKYFRENATGTAGNMPKINQTTVSEAPINLPSLEEQSQIIIKVENLFKHANSVEKQYKASKARLDKLSQSILARAFRGYLFLPLSESEDN